MKKAAEAARTGGMPKTDKVSVQLVVGDNEPKIMDGGLSIHYKHGSTVYHLCKGITLGTLLRSEEP
jgi:hypothetical protein